MKTKRKHITPRHRRTLLLGLLVASAPLTSATLAAGVAGTAKRIAPKRLPAVTVTTSAGQVRTNPKAVETSADVISCSDEAKDPVINKTEADKSVISKTESDKTEADNVPPTRWLRSSSSTASAEVARRLISQATRECSVGASLSAETSAWEAIRWAAEAVDLAERENGISASSDSAASALAKLQIARQAIREARDFSARMDPLMRKPSRGWQNRTSQTCWTTNRLKDCRRPMRRIDIWTMPAFNSRRSLHRASKPLKPWICWRRFTSGVLMRKRFLVAPHFVYAAPPCKDSPTTQVSHLGLECTWLMSV